MAFPGCATGGRGRDAGRRRHDGQRVAGRHARRRRHARRHRRARARTRWSATSWSPSRAHAVDPACHRVTGARGSTAATCTPGRSTPSSISSHRRRMRFVIAATSPTRLMAHVPAERCLGIIELLADGASSMPLGEIAERLELPKSGAHRLLATLVDLGWAEQDRRHELLPADHAPRDPRAAVLRRDRHPRHLPAAARPAGASTAASSRGLPSSTANSLVWVAHAQGASGGLVYQPVADDQHRAAVRDGERQGMARDARQPSTRSRTCSRTAASTTPTSTGPTWSGRSRR